MYMCMYVQWDCLCIPPTPLSSPTHLPSFHFSPSPFLLLLLLPSSFSSTCSSSTFSLFPHLFCQRTSADIEKRRSDTLQTILSRPPSIFIDLLGRETFEENTTLVFECLQSSALNKQLLFSLLDVVVLELFPELRDS